MSAYSTCPQPLKHHERFNTKKGDMFCWTLIKEASLLKMGSVQKVKEIKTKAYDYGDYFEISIL